MSASRTFSAPEISLTALGSEVGPLVKRRRAQFLVVFEGHVFYLFRYPDAVACCAI